MNPGETRAFGPNLVIRPLGPIMGLLALALLLPAPAPACSCYPDPVEKDFDEAIGVFDGTVLTVIERVTDDGWEIPYLEVTFSVHASWKGVTTARYTVTTAADDGMCGVSFPVFSRHVVFAEEGTSILGLEGPSTHSCTHNQPYEYAATLLDWLGEPAVTPTEPVTWGRLKAKYGP